MHKGSAIAVATLSIASLCVVGLLGNKFIKPKLNKDEKSNLFLERKKRKTLVREHLKKNNINGLPRLSVFRSNKNIYAQLIDDKTGTTIASASSIGLNIKGSDTHSAAIVGKLIGERAVEKGITDVVFDSAEYAYHGRVKALATAARKAGLKF